jgi:hypothetical protein
VDKVTLDGLRDHALRMQYRAKNDEAREVYRQTVIALRSYAALREGVPREPTAKMLAAAKNGFTGNASPVLCRAIWEAMYAAAQEGTPTGSDRE